MSREIGLSAIRLECPKRLAHTEYCSNEPLVREVTGKDPQRDSSVYRQFHDAWDVDLLWCTNDGPVPWVQRGRVTDMGHAVFLEDGRDRRPAGECPFHSAEEVLAFDATKEYGLPPFAELVSWYQDCLTRGRDGNPKQVFPGGYYKTIVSGAIETFGWEMLLEGAAYPARFEKVLDSFFQLSMHHFLAWAETDVDVFICHDDMVWSQGPFMHPSFYRDVIFPRYKALWKVLNDKGVKVLYCSDGEWTCFLEDIAWAGADGFIFEPMVDFDAAVERFGRSHVIVGSKVDCRTLTFGTCEQIKQEIDATLEKASHCPGLIFAVGNHIPSNVPVPNALFYMDYLRSHWTREGNR